MNMDEQVVALEAEWLKIVHKLPPVRTTAIQTEDVPIFYNHFIIVIATILLLHLSALAALYFFWKATPRSQHMEPAITMSEGSQSSPSNHRYEPRAENQVVVNMSSWPPLAAPVDPADSNDDKYLRLLSSIAKGKREQLDKDCEHECIQFSDADVPAKDSHSHARCLQICTLMCDAFFPSRIYAPCFCVHTFKLVLNFVHKPVHLSTCRATSTQPSETDAADDTNTLQRQNCYGTVPVQVNEKHSLNSGRFVC